MRNLEIKASGVDFARARRVLPALGARREPRLLVQTDWYFLAPQGRLKLRQRKGERAAEVIFYVRADAARPRASDYQALATEDAGHMLRLLRSMFTPGVCVRKRRELWLIGDTRIHLDEVAGLGRFLEIEVPVAGNSAAARRTMRGLVHGLAIDPACMLAVSYSDLLAGASPPPSRPRRSRAAGRLR